MTQKLNGMCVSEKIGRECQESLFVFVFFFYKDALFFFQGRPKTKAQSSSKTEGQEREGKNT